LFDSSIPTTHETAGRVHSTHADTGHYTPSIPRHFLPPPANQELRNPHPPAPHFYHASYPPYPTSQGAPGWTPAVSQLPVAQSLTPAPAQVPVPAKAATVAGKARKRAPSPEAISDDDDRELPPVSRITSAPPTTSSRKGKKPAARPKPRPIPAGKKAKDSSKQPSVKTEPADDHPKHRGRSLGATGYCDEEHEILVDLIRDLRPIGANAWRALTKEYNAQVMPLGYKERGDRALKQQFNRVSVVLYLACSVSDSNPSSAG
jgi:hypothetical protein